VEFEGRVRIVQTGENLGFGRGINRGVAASETPFVVALNPDVALELDAVHRLVAFLEDHDEAGVVGPRLRDAEGDVQASCGFAPRLVDEVCRKFLLHLIFPLFKFRRTRPQAAKQVDWVTGACFAARRDVFAATGGLDEAIFMYYEDVDFGLRVQNGGWQVWYLPDASGTHLGGESSKQALTRMLVVSEASYGYLIHKHLGRWAALLLVCLRPIEMVLRSVIWSAVYLLQPNRRGEARARLRAYFMILTGGVAKEAV
ncbi:MAG: N-acetylglucosaminyl-diphospho-decaprenol L-rhamnosyltransferase, partial [Candidatus Latescibacterota bacterium]